MVWALTETLSNTNYRNSERILRFEAFDHETAEDLSKRLLPYVQELVEIKECSIGDLEVGWVCALFFA